MRKILFITLSVLFICGFLPGAIRAGVIGRIGGPNYLPVTNYKIVVFEYDTPEQNSWGRDISQILSQEILNTIAGVGGVGVISLSQDIDKVQLSDELIRNEADRQNALVAIWGEFYSQNDNIYLHSHLRIFPRDKFKASDFGLTGEFAGGYMKAAPPTLQINFAPIKISAATLNKLHKFYEDVVNLKSQPDDSASVVGRLEPGDGFILMKKQNQWVRILVPKRNISGWVRQSTLVEQDDLAELQSVVSLSHGIIQFIAGHYSQAQSSFNDYLDHYGIRQNNMNRALVHLLLGNSYLRKGAGYRRTASEYEKAKYLLPNNAEPVNYLATVLTVEMMNATLEHGRPFPVDMFDEVERNLIHVIKTENNINAIRNLRTFYRTRMEIDRGLSDKAMQLITERLALLDNIETRVRARMPEE